MDKIYFANQVEEILEKIDFSILGKNVGIKLHFGEKGCTTFISPEIARKVYDKMISLNKKPTLIECNVLYGGERMKASSHVKLAREHGFTAMDIDILDDENGDEYVEIDGCKIGQGIEKYDSLIILTHFKGHGLAGFGGALKNVGMGLGSRAGKLFMHSDISPSINNNCIGCGLCAQHCSAKAICLNEGKAVIDSSKCIGCAMCIAVCSNKAVDIPWDGSTPEKLQRKTINYANAVVNKIGREKIIYINVLKNITKNCDCMAINEKSIMEDIGIIAGYNIVAIEKASLDLARKNCDAFDKMNDVDKDFPVNYAESIRLGTKDYEIENLWKK